MIADLNASDTEALDARDKRRLAKRRLTGIHFSPEDRLFNSWRGGLVFDYGDTSSRDMDTMLDRDGRARQLEQVLTLPIRGADIEVEPVEGDTGEAREVREVLGERLNKLVGQALNAVVFKKVFFELDWGLDNGRLTIDEVAWRPPATCEAAWDARTGRPEGFRQRIALSRVPGTVPAEWKKVVNDERAGQIGYVYVPPRNAFIHTHGKHRDPVYGTSDLQTTYWAYETRQKVLFLLFQFLEGQSLPKIITYGETIGEARELGEELSDAGASGIVASERSGEPGSRVFDVVESSGQGAQQFLDTVRYLEQQMTASVLASFQDLGTANSSGSGSYALSADQSEFFLKSRQAAADEVADSLRASLFKPLLQLNRGSRARVPKLKIGPLSRHDTQRALDLLSKVVTAEKLQVPRGFVDQLITTTSGYLGLDEQLVQDAVSNQPTIAQQVQDRAERQAAAASAPAPGPARPRAVAASGAPDGAALELSRTTSTLYQLVARVRSGEEPRDAARALLEARRAAE